MVTTGFKMTLPLTSIKTFHLPFFKYCGDNISGFENLSGIADPVGEFCCSWDGHSTNAMHWHLHFQKNFEHQILTTARSSGVYLLKTTDHAVTLWSRDFEKIVLNSSFNKDNVFQNWTVGFVRHTMFEVNNRITRTRCEMCSKLTTKTPERRQWRRFGVFIVNFEHISHLVLVFLLLTLSS